MKKIVRLTESDLVRLVKRVISESQVPSWAQGQSMNFYNSKDQMGKPFNISISSNSDDVWTDYDGNVDMKVSGSSFKGLKFSCYNQNFSLGLFELIDTQNRYIQVYNKTIAEKYFAPHFCSKNSQGKWVQKVENPDFAQTSMKGQQRTV